MAVTAVSWNAPASRVDAATFRLWGKGISDALTAIGMPKTADTGQIDWTSVAAPPRGVSAGYEVRYLDDSMHDTYPVFVKISYYGGTTANAVGFIIQVSKTTDGAGTLTNDLFPAIPTTYGSGAEASDSDVAWKASGDDGVYVFSGSPSASCYCPGFIIERSRVADAATGVGVLTIFAPSTPVSNHWRLSNYANVATYTQWYGGSPLTLPSSVNGAATTTASSMSKDGTSAAVIPIWAAGTSVPPWIMRSLIGIAPGDSGAVATFSATIDGVSRVWYGAPYRYPGFLTASGNHSAWPGAIMWAV